MEERFEISFSEGGVGALETIITGGLAKAVEKGLDTITGSDEHGWYCTIEDSITELKVTCWGPTKEKAQEKALTYIWKDIEDFEYEQEKEERVKEEERKRIQLEKEQTDRRRLSNDSNDGSSSSFESSIIKVVLWILGICLAVYVVIWLAINVVLPVAMLNSALIFAILTFIFKKNKTLFASLALVGGAYMILDVTNGWLSLLFVEEVTKNPYWISAFVYINAAAIGWCTWLLVNPLWTKTEQIEPSNKRKNLVLNIGLIFLVVIAVAIPSIIYNSVHNPFNNLTANNNQENFQSNTDSQNNQVDDSQSTMIDNQCIIDTYLGTIGEKEFKLFIETVSGESVQGYNVTGSNRRPVKGRIVNKRKEPTGLGGNYTIYKLILTEPGDDKWDGEFNIDLWISDIGRHGQGTWKSFNGKLERQIKIRDRINE